MKTVASGLPRSGVNNRVDAGVIRTHVVFAGIHQQHGRERPVCAVKKAKIDHELLASELCSGYDC